MNITGSFALILGAVFSTYVFMPKRRVLPYSLDPNQPGDEFLFNLLIAPFAIAVNFIASLPGTARALLTGPDPQPGAGHDPDRDRRVHPGHHRLAEPLRIDRALPSREVPRRALPVRRLPRLDRGLPRDPRPVHRDPARRAPPRGAAPVAKPPRNRLPRGGDSGAAESASKAPRSIDWSLAARFCAPYDGRCDAPPPLTGFGIVILAASLFGTLGPLSRFAYDAGMEPLAFVGWRALSVSSQRVRGVAVRRGRAPGALDVLPAGRLLLGVAAITGFTLNFAMFIAFDLVTVALALLAFYVPRDGRGRGRGARSRTAQAPTVVALGSPSPEWSPWLRPARPVGRHRVQLARVALALGAASRVFVTSAATATERPDRPGDDRDPRDDRRMRLLIAIATARRLHPLGEPRSCRWCCSPAFRAASRRCFLTGIRLIGGLRAGPDADRAGRRRLLAAPARRAAPADAGARRGGGPRRRDHPAALRGRRAGDRAGRRRRSWTAGPRACRRRRTAVPPRRACSSSTTTPWSAVACASSWRVFEDIEVVGRRPTAARRSPRPSRSARTSWSWTSTCRGSTASRQPASSARRVPRSRSSR